MDTFKVKKIICQKLDKYFILHTYLAKSTNSIYIKLDYGVCNSIRISDHNGKEKYKYRYNIRKDIQEKYEEIVGNCVCKYYSFDEINDLIIDVICDKELKKLKLGKSKYENQVEKAKEESKTLTNSFWKCCTSNEREVFKWKREADSKILK